MYVFAMYLCCNPPYEGGEKEDSGGDAIILNPINLNELELELATPTVLAQFAHCRSAETESIDMDIDYILITLNGEEHIELECEEDGKFLLTSLEAILGCDVTSLRYRNKATGKFKFVRIANGELLPPKNGWRLRLYYVSRKGDPCVGANSSAVKLKTQGVKEELETSIKCKFNLLIIQQAIWAIIAPLGRFVCELLQPYFHVCFIIWI